MYLSPVLTCCSLFLFSMLYLSPVLACCSLFLFMMLYVIPVLTCCNLFLFMLMHVIPVCHDVPYSRLSCSMLFCCMLIWCIQFFKKAWCTLFLFCILYLILMYAFPVFQFLTDVPYSDVSFSAPPKILVCLSVCFLAPILRMGTISQMRGRPAARVDTTSGVRVAGADSFVKF